MQSFEPIFTRDIALMKAMGANTIRLYTLKRSRRHMVFLDAAYEADLVVTGAFEMGDAAQTPLYSSDDMLKVKVALREQIRASAHPAFILWLVGNEASDVGFDPVRDVANCCCCYCCSCDGWWCNSWLLAAGGTAAIAAHVCSLTLLAYTSVS